jgi:hypothetical protein
MPMIRKKYNFSKLLLYYSNIKKLDFFTNY